MAKVLETEEQKVERRNASLRLVFGALAPSEIPLIVEFLRDHPAPSAWHIADELEAKVNG